VPGVVFVLGSYKFGGLEKRTLEMVRRLDRRRYRPLLAVMRPEGELKSSFEETGVPIHVFGLQGLISRSAPRQFRGLYRFARRHSARILHGSSFHGNFYAAFLALPGMGLKLVATEGGIRSELGGRHQVLRYLYHKISRRMVVNSPAVRAYVSQIPDSRDRWLCEVSNGVDTDRFDPDAVAALDRRALGLQGRGPVIGHVGRFRWEKGQLFLLDALREVLDRRPETNVLLVGDGPDDLAIRERLDAPPFRGRACVVGFQHDVRPFLRSMDVFVLPSVREGMSNGLLEAMAMSLPCVATEVGGAAQMLDGGRLGRLVTYGGREQLVDALLELVDAEEVRARLGRLSRERVLSRYSMDGMVRQYESIYDSVIAEDGW